MKVLVTGATGFIGNHVINELLLRNCEVIATSTSREKALLKSWYNKVEYLEYDINDTTKEEIPGIFSSAQVVIHLAWGGLPNYGSLYHIESELLVQFRFLKMLIKGGVKNLTITGTCFEYGMQEGCLNESKNISNPVNAYSLAKDSLRKFIELLKTDSNFSLKWLRLFYMYGDGQGYNSLISQLKRAIERNDFEFNMSKGDQIRDYLEVEQVAKYIVSASIQTKIDGIINISSNEPISIIQLVKSYLSARNKTISLNLGVFPYAQYEPHSFWGDNTKLKLIINE